VQALYEANGHHDHHDELGPGRQRQRLGQYDRLHKRSDEKYDGAYVYHF
jgi:hypothetical protein